MSGRENLVVERPGTTDEHGDRVPGTSFPLPGAVIVPTNSLGAESPGSGRTTSTTQRTVYVEGPCPEVFGTDRVRRANGELWHVVGRPHLWVDPWTDEVGGLELIIEMRQG